MTESSAATAATKATPHKRTTLFRYLDWGGSRIWTRIAIVLLLVLPLIFSAVYMMAMWDPSKNLKDIDLAVVNNDKGITVDGQQSNYGDDVVKGLLEKSYLSFEKTNGSEALSGMRSGKYLFVVTVPEDFSTKIMTIMDPQPQTPQIDVAYDGFNGTNAQVLTSALVPKIQAEVSSKLATTYSTKVLQGMNQLSGGLKQAADGAAQLDDGATKLHDGTQKATEGAAQLDDGANRLHNGIVQAADGTARLDNGASQLQNGAAQLGDGADRLQDGAAQLNDGAGRLSTGTNKLIEGSNRLNDATMQLGDGAVQIDDGVGQLTDKLIPPLQVVQNIVSGISPIIGQMRNVGLGIPADQLQSMIAPLDANNPTNTVAQLKKLKDGTATMRYMLNDPSSPYRSGMTQLNDGVGQANTGANQLHDGAGRLQNGTNDLKDGAGRLQNGTNDLKNGTTQLGNGITQLNDGSSQLVDGTGQLVTGANQLQDGSGQLKTGTSELNSKLSEGAKQAPTVQNVDGSANHIAVPVNFDEATNHAVQTLDDPKDPTRKTPSSGASILIVVVAGFMLMGLISIVVPHVMGPRRRTKYFGPVFFAWAGTVLLNLGALAVLAATSVGVGWQPRNWAMALTTMALMATAGASSFQLLRALFGRMVGGIAAMSVFALSLFSCGAVWPLSTVPPFLQIFHNINPMTYARWAFMRATDGSHDSAYAHGLLGLLAFTVVPFLATMAVRAARVNGLTKEQDKLLGGEDDTQDALDETTEMSAVK